MRMKSFSGKDLLYVSLAFRQASIVAVSSVLTTGDAARLRGICRLSNGDGFWLLELGLNSNDERGYDISREVPVFVEARVTPRTIQIGEL